MFCITSFYVFADLDSREQEEIKSYFEKMVDAEAWVGLLVMGPEGLNATLANESKEYVAAFQNWLRNRFPDKEILFKDSVSEAQPFRRFCIHVRPEIVTIGKPDLVPDGKCQHLSPEEWQQILDQEHDYVLLDTRNFYETDVGVFRGAIDPKITTFGEFPDRIKELGLPKDKKILMYCTGGIRCEKAILAMHEAGYDNCYQLEGGILAYLEKFPDRNFEGECFVFDQRVAVDQNLQPSAQYTLCPHCGNAGGLTLTCPNCKHESRVCQHCADAGKVACSKNCQYHAERLGLVSVKPLENTQ